MAKRVPAPSRAAAPSAPRQPYAVWSRKFLDHLAETSNVTASAKVAGVSTGTAYEAKRTRPEFNRQWRRALCEGYELLEMELLDRLRTGEIRNSIAKRGVRAFDNANAFRLLIAHRDEAGRQRAARDNEDTDAIIASIDAKLAKMRQRQLAAAAESEAEAREAAGRAGHDA
jgi:phage terminase small subunit